MAKYKNYDYSQRTLIPVSLHEQLVVGSLEFAIHYLVEERMDTSVLDERYQNDETGRWAYDPKVLLKVVLFGYSRGLVSSRKLEAACRENVTFMALACGQQPDHSTIAAFVSSMKGEILPLFRDVLLVCEEMGLLGGTVFALDGCKLPSNASKEWSGTVSDLRRKQEKIEEKVLELLREQEEADREDGERAKGGGSGGSDSGKQVEKLRRQAERIERFLKDNGPKIGRQGRELKSNITDNESAKMMTSHGTIQGYNSQALVDQRRQVIVYAEAFGEGQDHYHVPPMMEGAKKSVRALGHGEDYFVGKVLVADSNYHSPANLNSCEDEHLDAYIPDKNFRTRDPRFETQPRWSPKRKKKFVLSDFRYEPSTDRYVCPRGKRLKLSVKKLVVGGTIYRKYLADENDCTRCEEKANCLRAKNAKRRSLMVLVGGISGNLSREMSEKIDSPYGRIVYHQRIAIVEPAFANIRYSKGMDRFTLRGKIKVNIQWLLYCMVHNIGKIANYGFT